MTTKPNIILFITHDQGQFLGCYDTPTTPNSLQTPNIDKLAKDGIRFTNYFCTAPQCSPSRGSILTSLYPYQQKLLDWMKETNDPLLKGKVKDKR